MQKSIKRRNQILLGVTPEEIVTIKKAESVFWILLFCFII